MANGLAAEGIKDRAMLDWLFEDSRDPMLILDESGRVVRANPAWASESAWTERETVGRTGADLLQTEAGGAVGRLPAAGARALRFRRRDGVWRPCSARFRKWGGGVLAVLRPSDVDLREAAAQPRTRPKERSILARSAGVGLWSHEPSEAEPALPDFVLEALGYSPRQFASRRAFWSLMHPEDVEPVRAFLRSGLEDGAARGFEQRLQASDGTYATWRLMFEADPRPDGRFALRGIWQNITDYVRARDAALRGEQQSRQIVECAPFAVAMFDRELRYMVVSPNWLHGFGLDGREHIGLRLEEMFSGIPKRFVQAQKRALAGEVVTCKEDQFLDSRGQKHWIRWEARPWRDSAGRIGGVLAYADDISAIGGARREAEASARRLRMALGAAEAGVYEIDYVNQTFWASPEFAKMTGASQADYHDVLKLKFPAFHPDDVARVRAIFRAMQTGEVKSGEAFDARVLAPDGKTRWVRVFHHVDRNRSGRRQRGVGLILDFDARKRQELALVEAQRAAEAAGEAKAAFLANMSHEIRTPMNGVMGVLHLLKTEQLSQEGRAMLGEALSCGEMLAELLNDVIDFSKIEAGRLEIAAEPLNPRSLVEGVIRLLQPQAEAKGLTLSAEFDDGLDWISSDAVRLRQALFNLVGNAVKFTLKGRVVIRCRRVKGVDGPALRFEVEDTGVGIPAEAQPRIFQRFDQGDASTTRRFGGSGLGLAITQRLAEMMGGGVGFTSKEGRGSLFWLEIAAEPARAAPAGPDSPETYLAGLRILVVEDNATNRMIASKLLENLGAAVETAADGLLGVEAAARSAFDLVLMDVQMPGIDGLEAARRIRQLGGGAAETPIVALTANVLAHQRESYLAAGMNGVVGKPISPGALVAEIARLSAPLADASAA